MTGKRKWRGLRKNYEERRLWGRTVTGKIREETEGEGEEDETESRRWSSGKWEGDKAMREIGWRENVWWEEIKAGNRGEVNIRDSKGWRKPRTGWRKVGRWGGAWRRGARRGPGSSCSWEPQKELYRSCCNLKLWFPPVCQLCSLWFRRMPSGSRFLDPPPKRALALHQNSLKDQPQEKLRSPLPKS